MKRNEQWIAHCPQQCRTVQFGTMEEAMNRAHDECITTGHRWFVCQVYYSYAKEPVKPEYKVVTRQFA